VGASDRTVPRWVLVEAGAAVAVESTLDRVADEVRARLSEEPLDVEFDEAAEAVLSSALQAAEERHRALLSRRKQRALEELEWTVEHYRREAEDSGDRERLEVCERLLELLTGSREGSSVDLGVVADWWLQTIRPEWYEHLATKGTRRPARIRHLRKKLRSEPISTERLLTIQDLEVRIEPLDRRVVAAIVGVGAGYDA